MIFSYSKQK